MFLLHKMFKVDLGKRENTLGQLPVYSDVLLQVCRLLTSRALWAHAFLHSIMVMNRLLLPKQPEYEKARHLPDVFS